MRKQRKKYYRIEWKKSAVKSAKAFPKNVRIKIIRAVEELAENPMNGKPLHGDLKGLRRLRVSDLRIIYLLRESKLTVLIVKIRNRVDIYK